MHRVRRDGAPAWSGRRTNRPPHPPHVHDSRGTIEADNDSHAGQDEEVNATAGGELLDANVSDSVRCEVVHLASDPGRVLPRKVQEISFRRRLPDDLEAHGFGRRRSNNSSVEIPGRGSAMASSIATTSSSVSGSSRGRALSIAARTGSTSATRADFGAPMCSKSSRCVERREFRNWRRGFGTRSNKFRGQRVEAPGIDADCTSPRSRARLRARA